MIDDVKLLLERYWDLHNRVAIRDAGHEELHRLLGGLHELEVEGPHLSPLRKAAMLRAFRDHELVLWQISQVGRDVAFANYAWRDHPRLGGLIRIQVRDGRIARLTIRPGYSRIFRLIESNEFLESSGVDAFAS